MTQRMMKGVLVASLLLVPGTSYAQEQDMKAFVAPYFGSASGRGELTQSAPTLGVAGGWLGTTWGFEGDVGDTATFFAQDGFRTDRRVTTVMGSALYRVPTGDGPLGVYAAGGYGLMRPRVAEAGDLARVDVSQGAFNVGAGVMWARGQVGVRGDVRYFRGMGDEADDVNPFGLRVSTLDFTRATVGLVVGF